MGQSFFLRRVNLSCEPCLELLQGLSPMANLVLLALVHFRICLALVLEERVPACFGLPQLAQNNSLGRSFFSSFPVLPLEKTCLDMWNDDGRMTYQTQSNPGSQLACHQSGLGIKWLLGPGQRSTQMCTRLGRICLRILRGACACFGRRGRA